MLNEATTWIRSVARADQPKGTTPTLKASAKAVRLETCMRVSIRNAKFDLCRYIIIYGLGNLRPSQVQQNEEQGHPIARRRKGIEVSGDRLADPPRDRDEKVRAYIQLSASAETTR